jgi:hypothetical protein
MKSFAYFLMGLLLATAISVGLAVYTDITGRSLLARAQGELDAAKNTIADSGKAISSQKAQYAAEIATLDNKFQSQVASTAKLIASQQGEIEKLRIDLSRLLQENQKLAAKTSVDAFGKFVRLELSDSITGTTEVNKKIKSEIERLSDRLGETVRKGLTELQREGMVSEAKKSFFENIKHFEPLLFFTVEEARSETSEKDGNVLVEFSFRPAKGNSIVGCQTARLVVSSAILGEISKGATVAVSGVIADHHTPSDFAQTADVYFINDKNAVAHGKLIIQKAELLSSIALQSDNP